MIAFRIELKQPETDLLELFVAQVFLAVLFQLHNRQMGERRVLRQFAQVFSVNEHLVL